MKQMVLFGFALTILVALSSSNAVANDVTVLRGYCTARSHIAEGAIGEDLTKRQSRFFCNSLLVSSLSDDPKNLLVLFTDSNSKHGRLVGFTGMIGDKNIMNVRSVYLDLGQAIPVGDGSCEFFYNNRNITRIFCGAKIDEAGRRTVPIVSFDADPPSAPAPSNSIIPYKKSGVVNCSLPGTVIEFALNGNGGAQVARIESNYGPFLRAAKQARLWRAGVMVQDGKSLLVLDNGHKTRIMIGFGDDKGMAFSAEGGVSDILCQVLVNP